MHAMMSRVLTPGFIPVRMNKSGTHDITTSEGQILGWTADGSYPGSVVTSNALVIPVAGIGNVTAAFPYTGQNSWPRQVRLMRSGTQIGSTQSNSTAPGTLVFSIPSVAFLAGDTLYALGTSSGFNSTVTATGCYIQVSL